MVRTDHRWPHLHGQDRSQVAALAWSGQITGGCTRVVRAFSGRPGVASGAAMPPGDVIAEPPTASPGLLRGNSSLCQQ